jgi:hypothetical protein
MNIFRTRGRRRAAGPALLLAIFFLSPTAASAQEDGLRYPGLRWRISYGAYSGVERFAVDELEQAVEQYVPYVLEVGPARAAGAEEGNLLLVGTADEHPRIAELQAKGLVAPPNAPQGYSIACLESPWRKGARVVVLDGADAAGVLYAVEEFNKRTANRIPDDPAKIRAAFDGLKYFHVTESPAIEYRGLWTWGYVIYDYRRYIDNMARLKMNRLTIWNDTPPVNSREIIAYAHRRAVEVWFGFNWGWGVNHLDLANPEDLRTVKEQVVREYERDYRGLGLDGIYFQTLTENDRTMENGRSTAALAARWVNEIGGALLARHPSLKIQFGLHATSIQERYPDLKALDPRISIVWEDAGVTPYAYTPTESLPDRHGIASVATVDATIHYSEELASFRPGAPFAMVAKGWTTLRWDDEFEHHGPFILGERSAAFIAARERQRQPRWDEVNAKWLALYPAALRFFREVRASTKEPMSVQGLVEDGLFEQRIEPSIALLGEMLWNPNRDVRDYLTPIFSPYFQAVVP